MELTFFVGILVLLQNGDNVYGACDGGCFIPPLTCPSGSCTGQSYPNQVPSGFDLELSDIIYSSDKKAPTYLNIPPTGEFCNTLESCCALCNTDPLCVQYYYVDQATAPKYSLSSPACGLNYAPASFVDSNIKNSTLTASGYTNNTDAKCVGYVFDLYPVNDLKKVVTAYYAESENTDLRGLGATYLGKICGPYTGTSCCQMCINDPNCKRFYLDLTNGVCGLDYTPTTGTLVSHPYSPYVAAGYVASRA